MCSLADLGRDPRLLCMVENPADGRLPEASASYRGRYFVLMGWLSPLDGMELEGTGML